jgi:hypothetical protein
MLNVEGDAVIPAGKPVKPTLTLDVNVLISVTLMVVLTLWPPSTVKVAGEAEMEKSPCGGGGGVVLPLPPPQPVKSRTRIPIEEKQDVERQTAYDLSVDI